VSVAALQVERIGVKLYAADPGLVEVDRFIAVFHDWIRRGAVPGLLIDVADYSHIHEGPGVMLIGHEADHALDLGEGRPGLLYQRKRDSRGDLRERLRQALTGAVVAAAEAEAEPGAGPIAFRTDEFRVVLLDRLAAPNDEATLAALRPALEDVLAEAYPGREVTLERIGDDAREPFGVRVRVAGAPALAELRRRLDAAA
jgi:hypothetical protein